MFILYYHYHISKDVIKENNKLSVIQRHTNNDHLVRKIKKERAYIETVKYTSTENWRRYVTQFFNHVPFIFDIFTIYVHGIYVIYYDKVLQLK